MTRSAALLGFGCVLAACNKSDGGPESLLPDIEVSTLNLDFGDARFFDDDYDALVCCHHGARYRPETGECVCGPCEGGRLTALRLEERGAEVWCVGVARRA